MPRPIQPSAFNYQIPTLIQGVATSAPSSGSTGYVPGGAFSLQVPDNTVIGGNPRGLGAVDLQTQRTAATQVASGTGSFVAGVNSTASGNNSIVLGSTSTASGDGGVAIGTNSSASSGTAINNSNAGVATAIGNSNATGTGSSSSFYAGGSSCAGNFHAGTSVAIGASTALESGAVSIGSSSSSSNSTTLLIKSSGLTASYSNCMAMHNSNGSSDGVALHYSVANGGFALKNSTSNSGGFAALSSTSNSSGLAILSSTVNQSGAVALMTATSSQKAKFNYAGNCVFSAAGDCQTGLFVSRAATTTNTPVVLTSDGAAAGTTNQLIAATNLAIAFTGELIGKQSGSANTVAYTIEGRLVNNAGTVTMPTGTLTIIGTDAIVLDTAPTLAADNTNKGLTVTSGSKTTTNIRWVCTLRTTEVLFA